MERPEFRRILRTPNIHLGERWPLILFYFSRAMLTALRVDWVFRYAELPAGLGYLRHRQSGSDRDLCVAHGRQYWS